MSIQEISVNKLRRMENQEGLIIQGCGGDLQEWVDGINEMLIQEGILKKGTKFEDVYSFHHGDLTCLLFPFKDDVPLDMSKLAVWRIQSKEAFGSTWLSDFVPNELGGFLPQKPDCPLIGWDGNIFALMGVARKTLRENGLKDEAKEMCDRITQCHSYGSALSIIGEYVNITDDFQSMPDGGSAAGWKFEVYSGENKLMGTYTTGEDGSILTDYLLPGEYAVKEIIPDGSPYICDLPNPKSITVEAGKTAEVTFTNRLKPGEISIQKVDTRGNPLAGAEFLLEWSVDGSVWEPVAFTDSLDVKEGTCTSDGLQGGKLTSGADGMVRFIGLHSGSLYRVTETKAPEGYQLLTEPVHEGRIQVGDEYFVQLTVVNAPVFELPMTGSVGETVQTGLQITGALIVLGILLYIAFKKRR